MARILLFGKDGQLGKELKRAFASQEVLALGRQECDLSKPDTVSAAVRQHRPEIIVNAAAYTAVDKAESEPALADAINAGAPAALAAAASGARIVHYSTDYVFDGSGETPWVESDNINPLNVYGKSKRSGEQALLASGPQALVLRTSWVYSAHGRNFVDTMLRLGAQRSELRVVDDQHGAPTAAADLADATAQILAGWNGATSGIFHITAQGEATWAEFARAIFEEAGMKVNVVGIPSSEYPTPACRPKNSRLNCDKLYREFGIRLPHWRESLHGVMQQVLAVQS